MAYVLHQLLTETAARYPEKEAIRYEGESLTYGQLDKLTDKLALTLREKGIKKGDRVGIYVHKSFASLIGIFGIMKAGGVYVPLDPNAPVKRLAYITRNCDIRVLITSTGKQTQLEEFFVEGTPVSVLLLTDDGPELKGSFPEKVEVVYWEDILLKNEHEFSPIGVIETDLAYILYTSGSTGNPKGVMISHRTIFTFINWCYEKFQITSEDRVTSHAPLHFDLSTFDIYVTIKAGGTVVLIPEKLSVFPIRLVKLLQDESITVTYLVPSILSLMVNYGKLNDHDLSNLRLVLFAGEVFPIKYLRELVAAVPLPDYYNLYGPTETNVCTYYRVQAHDIEPDKTQPVPIGKACENMEVFAVGDDGQLITSTGEEGELWARGSCVAQGYWGDEEKTKQNFVINPYQENFSEIAYRTGDIVTLHEDGVNWIYIGRRDHMIKSRGYRIELGEIESALYSHEMVKEAAVVAIPDDLVGNRIKAFVVPMEDNGLTVRDLESHAAAKLPRYMMPESIEFKDGLPKTSTGKINRPLLVQQAE